MIILPLFSFDFLNFDIVHKFLVGHVSDLLNTRKLFIEGVPFFVAYLNIFNNEIV